MRQQVEKMIDTLDKLTIKVEKLEKQYKKKHQLCQDTFTSNLLRTNYAVEQAMRHLQDALNEHERRI